ncbi:MAG: hypothetical protein L6R37_008051 [Teloschistes peruensis]|nr:MAG: hypothetical protein L6R37_008051 [Teloschistes peruensis]
MRSQYHNIHHPNAPTRGRPGPVPVVPNLQAQQQREKQIMEAREKEKAQRRAFKPADKNMPDGIDDFIIGDGIRQYKRMREFERKLDAMLMRKRFDMVDTRQNVVTRYKKMRIWISNTFDVQSRPGEGMDHDMYDLSGISEGMFRMKIEGCLLDDDDDDKSEDSDSDGEKDDKDGDAMDQDAQPTQKPIMPAILQPKTKLSHFFKEININPERSKNVQPDSMTQIVWRKPEIENTALVLPPEADFDSLEIERKIDAPVNCTINLFRDDLPKRYLLTEPLAELLDTRIEDRRTVLLGLHDYIRAMNLQKDEEKRAVQCDERLRKVIPAHPKSSKKNPMAASYNHRALC